MIPRALILAAAAAGCGWLPPDHPVAPPPPADPDAPLLRSWAVTAHQLGPHALIGELDAAELHGRRVELSATGYRSPWSGHCDDAARHKLPRRLAEVAALTDLAADQLASLGLAAPIVEYQLSCRTPGTPGLVVYLAGDRAVSCGSGVCYGLVLAAPATR